MAVVRPAVENSQTLQPLTRARVQAADFGAEAVGRGIESLGRGLNQVAGDFEDIRIKDEETLARDADNRYSLRKTTAAYEGPDALFNATGRNALTREPDFRKALVDIDTEAEAELKGKPHALEMYRQAAAARNRDLLTSAARHVGQQREVFAKQTAQTTIETAIQGASAAYQDPDLVEMNMATAAGTARSEMLRQGGDDQMATQAAREARTQVAAAVSARLELKSPSLSQAFLLAHAEDLNQVKLTQLLGAVDEKAAVERADAGIDRYLVTAGSEALPPAASGEPRGNTVPTPVPARAAMYAAIGAQESGNRERDARGRLITSPAGAQGQMQVMPGTNLSPGFGVTPAQNNSDAERSRVGRDYYDAMLKRYKGNVVMALTAYNWGPGNVDKYAAKKGDPRTGQISDSAWAASIPVREAREYAARVLSKLGVSPAKSSDSPAAQVEGPSYAGQEIDLTATIARIDSDPELSFVEKNAYKAAARERHTLGKQARAEADNQLTDDATEAMIALGDRFTNYNQLPQDVRVRLDRNPSLKLRYVDEASVNKRRQEAEADEARREAKADRKEQDADRRAFNYMRFTDMMRSDPKGFAAAWRQDRSTLVGTMELPDWKHFDEVANNIQRNGGLPTAEVARSQVVERARPVLANAGLTLGSIPRNASPAVKEQHGRKVRQAEDALTERVQDWQKAHPNQALTERVILDIAAVALLPVVTLDGKSRFAYEAPAGRVNIPTAEANRVRRMLMLEGLANPSENDIVRRWADIKGHRQ